MAVNETSSVTMVIANHCAYDRRLPSCGVYRGFWSYVDQHPDVLASSPLFSCLMSYPSGSTYLERLTPTYGTTIAIIAANKMPTIQERPGMYAPSDRQPTYASPQAIRVQKAKQQSRPVAPGQIPPIRSITAPPLERREPPVSASGTAAESRVDTPQQVASYRELQQPHAIPISINPQSTHGFQTSRNASRSRGIVSIPAWVNEITAPQPRHFRSSLLQNEAFPQPSNAYSEPPGKRDTENVYPNVATCRRGTWISTLRRDSATPTHSELFFENEAPVSTPDLGLARPDAYRSAQHNRQPDAICDMYNNQETERNANETRHPNTATGTYQRNNTPVQAQPGCPPTTRSYSTLRRLSLRLPADPQLTSSMFDGITGDADAMLDSITGVSPWDLETSGISVGELSEPEEVQKAEEEEEDFGWIRATVSES
jgi:hypothetical protein